MKTVLLSSGKLTSREAKGGVDFRTKWFLFAFLKNRLPFSGSGGTFPALKQG
jgi:hypothetical protein